MIIKFLFNFDIYQFKIAINSKLFKIIFEIEDNHPYISLYLFSIKIYRRLYRLNKEYHSIINALTLVNTTNGKSTVSYGFNDPFATGIMYGALSYVANVEQYPDFLPKYEYIIVDGSTRIYFWSTIMNYIKYKRRIEV